MTTMSDDLPTARTRPASNWSAIWILPLIALVIGGWLGWQAYREAGVNIEVRFESGEGIVANKTEVVYKGMSVGGGPAGVGRAVNETVVYAFMALFVINVVVTAIGIRMTTG